jgi:hypothetical protein
MKMIAHEHIGVHADAENLKRAQTLQKTPSVMIVVENHAPAPNRLTSILTSLSATPWESLPAGGLAGRSAAEPQPGGGGGMIPQAMTESELVAAEGLAVEVTLSLAAACESAVPSATDVEAPAAGVMAAPAARQSALAVVGVGAVQAEANLGSFAGAEASVQSEVDVEAPVPGVMAAPAA